MSAEPMPEYVRVKVPPDAHKMGRKVDWQAITDVAREHPDEWVLVPVTLHVSVAANIRRGQYTHIKPEEFEVTTRKADEDGVRNRVHLYVKVRS